MKKLLIMAVFLLVLSPISALAVCPCENGNNQIGQENYQSTKQAAASEPQSIEKAGQSQAEIQQEVENSKPTSNPRSATAREHMSVVAQTVEELINMSYQIENQGLGEEIREIARDQGQDEDKAVQALDKARSRRAVVKFLIGPDYKQLKEVKRVMERNQQRIKEMNRIMTQTANEGEESELQLQIAIMEQENEQLQDQINELTSGFSLLGWLNKLINSY